MNQVAGAPVDSPQSAGGSAAEVVPEPAAEWDPQCCWRVFHRHRRYLHYRPNPRAPAEREVVAAVVVAVEHSGMAVVAAGGGATDGS